VLSLQCQTNGTSFHAVCEFEFTGAGLERNVFDNSVIIAHHLKNLQAGQPLTHQLAAIDVAGTGSGRMEIEGFLTNGMAQAAEVKIRFNCHGKTSPVTISLQDLVWREGAICPQNEMVARVNSLTFRREPGSPKMEVVLDSVKAKDAGDSFWQNLVGGLKGAAVNMFLPPLTVTAQGRQVMLDFGLALATAQPSFTFPSADRLKASLPAP
jgi:hypothetical protein